MRVPNCTTTCPHMCIASFHPNGPPFANQRWPRIADLPATQSAHLSASSGEAETGPGGSSALHPRPCSPSPLLPAPLFAFTIHIFLPLATLSSRRRNGCRRFLCHKCNMQACIRMCRHTDSSLRFSNAGSAFSS